ncbi:FAD-dependent oxidoreductase [Sphingorhabdus sp. Alg239-R122]|uniref:NAD(P)/FAD-dependent oxidoreductase n=1 Tax=Sphingorhabdus sp. Alg239-R122 TaxID=2305989 RepID=UPI0013D9CFC2|nr:FAD-dependent oxidoreductase [Sphingorhabdus sp. Alg239-R122]
MSDFDIVIIGAGIAGASLASELAGSAKVMVAEREEFPGYHSTGRSAAFWTESYGGPQVQPLTSASGPWFANPPSHISAHSLLVKRGALTIGKASDKAALKDFYETFAGSVSHIHEVGRDVLEQHVGGLDADYQHGVYEPDCCDIDVAAVHQGYLRHARAQGAQLRTRTALESAQYADGQWHLGLGGETITAAILVNAAGAWADNIAQMASVAPLNITPYRRTVLQLQVAPTVSRDLPLVLDINGNFYFKPENGRLWLSPHDETETAAGDVAPEELDIATTIDRFEKIVNWKVVRLEKAWAGLRSFAPDRLPVYGFDSGNPGFFWFAGQGGFGIQTAPAAAKIARMQILEEPAKAMVEEINPAPYAPARFCA